MDELLYKAKQAVSEANHLERVNRTKRNVPDKAIQNESEAFRKAKRLINEYVAAGGKREDILG